MGESTTGEPLAETAKVAFRLDGLLARMRDGLTRWNESFDHFMLVMRNYMESVREPKDYANESDYERGFRMGSQLGGYREAPNDDRRNTNNGVIVGCTVALISTLVVSAWALSYQFTDFRGRTEEWKVAVEKRLERLENQRQ